MRRGLTILLFILSCNLFATNYYVDNTGTGDTLATIAEVNTLTLAGDDTVFFKKGCEWEEKLVVPNSGTKGHYIVFTNYGTESTNPEIIGSTTAVIWTETGTANVWQSATSVTDPFAGSSGNIFFLAVADTIIGDHKVYSAGYTNLVNEYDWTWNSNTLYVYAATDPDDRYVDVEASQLDYGIALNSKNYIEINAVDIYFQRISGVYNTSNTVLTGLTVRNCNIAYSGSPDGFGYGIHVICNNGLFEYNEIWEHGRRGISLYNYTSSDIDTIIVQNNIFHNGYHVTGVDLAPGSTTGSTGDISEVIIRNNLFYDEENVDVSGTAMISIYGAGTDTGISHDIYIYNNVLKYIAGYGIFLWRKPDDIFIYNNTFYGINKIQTSGGAFVYINKNEDDDTKIYVKNNIFYLDAVYATNTSASVYYLVGSAEFDHFTSDYNLYYNTDALARLYIHYNPTVYYRTSQWADWKTASGWDANSPTPADPSFTDDPTDLTLAEGSPAIGAGIGVGLVTDFAGSVWKDEPSIGAYEYDSELPTPTDLAELTTNPITTYNAFKATITYEITSNGGGTITERGVVYSTSANPTTSSSKVSGTGDVGSYTSYITNLSGGTTYHVRAYAINESGTSYGSDQNFTTPEMGAITSGGSIRLNGQTIIWR